MRWFSPTGGGSAWDRLASLVLILLAVWLFRGQFFGSSVWIGNPDRLNSDLKVLEHYLGGLSGGGVAAWNEHEMMGYDSFVLPYTYPNPLVYVTAAFGEQNRVITMGYIVIAMLAAAGLAAYWFLRAELPAGLPVLAAAVCYEFCSLTVLKASQNSMSFAVFIVIPLLALAVRSIRPATTTGCFLALTLLLGCMLGLMFLQKAGYALMLIGAYAAWRSLSLRSWRPVVVLSLALGSAALIALPRVAGVAKAMPEYARAIEGLNLKDFETLYTFQNIRPYDVLRWFDYGVFGRSPSEADALGNNINLTEGFLLHTSAIAPLLLLTGMLRDRCGWLNPFRAPRRDAAFFFWVLSACVSVVVLKPAAHAMFLLFLRVDFTHARVLIAALLPLCVLLALALTGLAPRAEAGASSRRALLAGLVGGFLAALVIDVLAGLWPGALRVPGLPNMLKPSLARVALSAALYLALLWIVLRGASAVRLREAGHAAICALLASQCLLAVDDQVNGPRATKFLRPFRRGNFYQAQRDEFRPPSREQLRALHWRLKPDRYRIALLCDHNIADGFCAGHVPEFWQLRAVDGYYGLGVPQRLRALPWRSGLSLRTISFTSRELLPWDLLGFLNVRSVLVAGDGVYRNIVRDGERIVGRPDPAAFEVISSPARVTPRAFFASAVEPAASPEDAARQIFRPEGIVDPEAISFVEGLDRGRRLAAGGAIALRGERDVLDLDFAPAEDERFLVLNELYYPGWRAELEGRALPILATNVVMRGVFVPADASHLRFRYESYSTRSVAWAWRVSGVLAVLVVLVVLRRQSGAAA